MEINDKKARVLELIPFSPTSQSKLSFALREEVNDTELFLVLSSLVQDGEVLMSMGVKGPEYYRKWNLEIDEERKRLSKELNTRFSEVIFFPRFDGYVANVKDNFNFGEYNSILDNFLDVSEEYVLWHRNAKTGLIYPPKLNALSSSTVMSLNIVNSLGVNNENVIYGANYEVLVPEPMHDRPDEISAPRVLFDAIINYDDAVDYIQSTFLEQFYQPSKPGLWPFQYGDRFLFDNDEAKELIHEFSKTLNPIYFDATDLIKSITAIYSDILASPEEYLNKKVHLFKINFELEENTSFPLLYDYAKLYNAEGKDLELRINELLAKLPLPEGVSLEYQFLSLSEVVNTFEEDKKDYFIKRYFKF